MSVIRVVKTTVNDFGPHNGTGARTVSEDVVWQGSDISELSRTHPPSKILFADPLGRSEIEDGLIRFTHRFEEMQDGEWELIEDPRVRLTPMTEGEIEQDAENRRLFPGDFVDECEINYSEDEECAH